MSYPPVVGLPDSPLTEQALTQLADSTAKITNASPVIRGQTQDGDTVVYVASLTINGAESGTRYIAGFDADASQWVVLDRTDDGEEFNTTVDALGVWAAEHTTADPDTLTA